ncbi:hypothetical protein OIU84_020635 [Salix udensis]|nr:hypothetical protein OIU84_020635 [Salix udensis]
MEDKYQEREKRPGSARIPPRRGQIKARILRKLVQKVKKVVSVLAGLAKKGCGNGGSASTSTYTSEGHSDY